MLRLPRRRRWLSAGRRLAGNAAAIGRRPERSSMKTVLLVCSLLLAIRSFAGDGSVSKTGVASWYGEAHRGRLMANRQPFDPDQFTAASWFYPLGTRVRVTLRSQPERSVLVT